MKPTEMTLFSTADLVVEPPHLFEEHFPVSRRDDAPRLVEGASGAATWVFQGVDLGRPGAGVAPRIDADGPRGDVPGYTELARSTYDSGARVETMDRNGVWASLSAPLFAGVSGDGLFALPDAAASRMVVSAYNDWQVAWCAEQPGRLLPLAALPVWDVEAAVAEVLRIAPLGVRAVTFPESPAELDLPGFATDHWDPLFASLCDHGIALVLAPARGGAEAPGADLNPFAGLGGLLAPQAAATACTDIVVSGVLQRFPELRIANAEGGIGWIPFLLDRIDLHVTNQVWTGLDLGATGTDVFRRHFLGCFTSDPSTLFLRERIGVEAIAWSAAFPGADSAWPSSPEALAAELSGAGVADEEIDLITWRNAARFLGVDLPEDRAVTCVGALRGEASCRLC